MRKREEEEARKRAESESTKTEGRARRERKVVAREAESSEGEKGGWGWLVAFMLIGVAVIGVSLSGVFLAEQGRMSNVADTIGGGSDYESKTIDVTTHEDTMTLDFGSGVTMELPRVPAGEFMMGSNGGEADDDEKPVHRVRITEPFYMSATEVTQEQYGAVMGEKPWSGQDYAGRSKDAAATYVSWNDAQEFCEKVSEKTGHEVRLPTEAQWEYACRADSETAYCFGDSEDRLGEYAWYHDNASGAGEKYPHSVAQKKPNAWGLYDMHGNVWEWCRDWYDEDYYENSAPENPEGPSQGDRLVLRGGCWLSDAWLCRSTNRDWLPPAGTLSNLGFRVVVLLSPRS